MRPLGPRGEADLEDILGLCCAALVFRVVFGWKLLSAWSGCTAAGGRLCRGLYDTTEL